MARYLKPTSDLVFKRIFGEHEKIVKSFLNAILPLKNGTSKFRFLWSRTRQKKQKL